MISDKALLLKLYECFPEGFINSEQEFIADSETNLYFILGNCENELDVKCKILEWFSRDAFKAQPYKTRYRNTVYNEWVLRSINSFLDTEFTTKEIEEIYTYLGNAIDHKKTEMFVKSGYDMRILTEKSSR